MAAQAADSAEDSALIKCRYGKGWVSLQQKKKKGNCSRFFRKHPWKET